MTAKAKWFNVTMKDKNKIRVQAHSKPEAISRVAVHCFRNKQEWIVESANPTKVEPMAQLPFDDGQLDLAAAEARQ